MPMPFVSHHKCHVALHFKCLDLRIAVVLLMMPLASYDANATANDIT